MHGWDTESGNKIWKQTIQKTTDVEIQASGIFAARDAAYVSTIVSSKQMTFRTVYMDKFSKIAWNKIMIPGNVL